MDSCIVLSPRWANKTSNLNKYILHAFISCWCSFLTFLTPEGYLKPSCTCIYPTETRCKWVCLTLPPLRAVLQPPRRRPLFVHCCFPSLSPSEWWMAITCVRGVASPSTALPGIYHPPLPGTRGSPTSGCGWCPILASFLSWEPAVREGAKHPALLWDRVWVFPKASGSDFQQFASTKHSLFNSCLQFCMIRLPSMSCWHSRCSLQSTQKWLVKENLFLSSSPLKIWGASQSAFTACRWLGK